MYGPYYQAQAVKENIWFVMGATRNQENWAFTRTLDAKNNLLEFFVSPDYETEFASFLEFLHTKGYLVWYKKMENRLINNSVD